MTHINRGDYFPPHYDARPVAYEVILEDLGIDLEDFYLGSIIKYLYRYPHKESAVMDLIKARSYLNLLIDVVERGQNKNSSKETK